MIITEQISETLVRTYSDANVYIRGGNPVGDYVEAIDPIDTHRTYVETDIPIIEEVAEEEYAEIGRLFMGVSE